ncbi:TSC10 [Candida pseudojiufengensis]|uniref:TSC10 n=1 Tax=Candida pseudojiufengensis TaxID=497109 RepID=UPI002224A60F|nr:TSC10 [Candida pseudojiufengensis]KAI5958449.1 TSC10 [Candida pseudojiufengensis]
MWFSKSNFPVDKKCALIIGGSQGVGVDLAEKLYKQNCSIILVARNKLNLQKQVDFISNLTVNENHTATVTSIPCDVSNYDNCVTLWKEITTRGYDPTIIFCCAGSSIPKLFQDLTPQDLQSGININYNTALNVIHSGFKHIQQSNPQHQSPQNWSNRHIILFSSVVSFFPFIGYGQYGPMKSAITSLSLVLRQELKPYNFRVSCVFPGNFQSEGYEEEQKTKPEITKKIEGPSKPISGSECAEIIIDQLSKGYDTITTDFIGWVLGCSVLGMLPRQWSIFQVPMSFIFSIIAPILNWSINNDIAKSFKQN